MLKLFTATLNTMLCFRCSIWFSPYRLGTAAIFALSSMINKTLSTKRRLYCCFIDYRKHFDSI